MTDVSVIISAGERPQDVVAVIDRLATQTVRPAEIVVSAPQGAREIECVLATKRTAGGVRVTDRDDVAAVTSETSSELVAFLDANLLPEAHWVEAICAGSDRHRGAPTMFGPVSLAFDGARPEWLAADAELFLRWLGRFELGARDLQLHGDEDVVDVPVTNVVVRRDVIRASAVRSLAACEAARQIVARQWAAGAPACYLGNARATRRVPREQSVPRWFVLRAFDEGRASAAGLAALGDVLPAGALAAFAATKGDELATTLRRLELLGISFSRLPLRWRAELGELMGLVAGVQNEGDYKLRFAHVDPKILDGDAPEAFVSWLDDVTRSTLRTSVGAA